MHSPVIGNIVFNGDANSLKMYSDPRFTAAANPGPINVTMVGSCGMFVDYFALIRALVETHRADMPEAFTTRYDEIMKSYQPTFFTAKPY